MTIFAVIENSVVAGTCYGDPAVGTIVMPDGAVAVPEGLPVASGWRYVDGEFLQPLRTIGTADVRAGLTLSERVKWDSAKIDEVATVRLEFASPRSMTDAEELLDFLVQSAIISQTSMDKVLA